MNIGQIAHLSVIETVQAHLIRAAHNEESGDDRKEHHGTCRPSHAACTLREDEPVAPHVGHEVKERAARHEQDDDHLQHKARREFAAEERIDECDEVDCYRSTGDEDREEECPATDPKILLLGVLLDVIADHADKHEEERKQYDKRCDGKTDRT